MDRVFFVSVEEIFTVQLHHETKKKTFWLLVENHTTVFKHNSPLSRATFKEAHQSAPFLNKQPNLDEMQMLRHKNQIFK